jgi:membrane protein DedA with SNARE-associated domain
VGLIIAVIGLALIGYLIVQNNVVPYDQIDHHLANSIFIVAVVLGFIGILLVLVYNIHFRKAKTKQSPS